VHNAVGTAVAVHNADRRLQYCKNAQFKVTLRARMLHSVNFRSLLMPVIEDVRIWHVF